MNIIWQFLMRKDKALCLRIKTQFNRWKRRYDSTDSWEEVVLFTVMQCSDRRWILLSVVVRPLCRKKFKELYHCEKYLSTTMQTFDLKVIKMIMLIEIFTSEPPYIQCYLPDRTQCAVPVTLPSWVQFL